MVYILPFTLDAIIIITAIIGSFHYKKYKNTPLKYFLFLLWYGIFTEAMGIVVSIVFKYPNYIVYNIYVFIRAMFLLWLFSKYLKKTKSKQIVKYFIYLTVLFFIINTLFVQNIFKDSQSYFYFFGGILLIVTILIFFIEILNSEAILKIKNVLIFWVAAGVLLFELGFTPVFIANKYINYSHGLTYGYILLLLNLITSVCFSLGFIWSKKGVDY